MVAQIFGAAFIPRVGDRVEFHSDKQTEKGPSSGSVIAANRLNRTAVIRHSDHPGEVFHWAAVKVEYLNIRGLGDRFWMLE